MEVVGLYTVAVSWAQEYHHPAIYEQTLRFLETGSQFLLDQIPMYRIQYLSHGGEIHILLVVLLYLNTCSASCKYRLEFSILARIEYQGCDQ
ncbi:hypothetical protein HanXRQr2_Chr01g0042121 [Helianthus annuus]|uniref:Uncharacterized protein n=1 Tax=Helianthus annuus TaxID=4232 RepID=A0A9K3P541_HELAN|nr:hypothetical protein HanXRQr2_Chr01g0042121 [Helianthus annuus]KAJ0958622.1 hypothetical protein HanPSC8_Chr01g0040961 [Helianthus annuus]